VQNRGESPRYGLSGRGREGKLVKEKGQFPLGSAEKERNRGKKGKTGGAIPLQKPERLGKQAIVPMKRSRKQQGGETNA